MSSYLFISNILPGDDINPEIDTQKATYLAQKGIIDALSQKVESLTVLAYPQFPRYFQSHIIWRSGNKRTYRNVEIVRIATFNLPVIRILFRNLAFLFMIVKWCIKSRGTKRHIIQYNVSSPSLMVTLAGHLFKDTDVSAFLYDLGMPPSSYNYSWAKLLFFKVIDYQAKILINRLDYVFAITEAVIQDYAQNTKAILVDGGISEDVLRRLPLPDKRFEGKCVLLLAGNLTETNGVLLALDAAKILKDNSNIEIWFAGKGDLVEAIKAESKANPKVKYIGFLTTDELFEVYSQIDVLLNLRVMPEGEGKYLFPSKLLEYMVTGRYVISTDFAHVKEQYGYYCDILLDRTPQSLANVIMKHISNKRAAEKGINAQKYMLETHTWEAQVEKVVYLIDGR